MPAGYRVTKEEAIARAVAKHGDEYDYSRVEFDKLKDKVLITHKICGKLWSVSFANHINSGVKCAHCYGTHRKTTESFLKECIALYPNSEYSFERVVYGSNNRDKVTIICNKCQKEFDISPINFLVGKSGCPPCAIKENSLFQSTKRTTKKLYIEKAVSIHGVKFDYSLLDEFVPSNCKIKVKCNHCSSIFTQSCYVHLRPEVRCPSCLRGAKWKSYAETEWLDKLNISQANRHKMISKKNVDALVGNIIYEFYGGYWHGDPRKKDAPRELLRERYMKTMAREKILKEAGYDIVFVWEHDYKNGLMFSKEHPTWTD